MILCCGEALIDMLPRTLTDGSQAFLPVPGGSVFNTAVAIGRLGAPAGLLSGLSSDFFGDMLRAALIASDVDFRFSTTASRPTALAFVRFVDGQPSYAFHDENTAGRMIAKRDLPLLTDAIDALFFGGISLIGEPCGSTYEALMRRANADRVTMLDPNIRPDLIADENAHRARLGRLIGLADIVKLSDEDLAWLTAAGGIETNVRAILSRGPRLVILTRGAYGATAYTGRHRVAVAGKPVAVIDTVGAGDTFNAGVLTALKERGKLSKEAIVGLTESDLEAALDLGTAAAAVTVSRAGADLPWRFELHP